MSDKGYLEFKRIEEKASTLAGVENLTGIEYVILSESKWPLQLAACDEYETLRQDRATIQSELQEVMDLARNGTDPETYGLTESQWFNQSVEVVSRLSAIIEKMKAG